ADLIINSLGKTISAKTVTYDFARLMDNPQELSCSAFGDAMIGMM
ncbi:MAG: NADP-dependent isocitrate dehydrogenase, partial [Candidatus Thiodiazotropha endolucinida]